MNVRIYDDRESTWNRENRFTGWVDVPLTEKGKAKSRTISFGISLAVL